MIRKEKDPNVFVFSIKSIGMLERVLKDEDKQMVMDIWNIAYNKFVNNIEKFFVPHEISG